MLEIKAVSERWISTLQYSDFTLCDGWWPSTQCAGRTALAIQDFRRVTSSGDSIHVSQEEILVFVLRIGDMNARTSGDGLNN
jgi:hypothetical protein